MKSYQHHENHCFMNWRNADILDPRLHYGVKDCIPTCAQAYRDLRQKCHAVQPQTFHLWSTQHKQHDSDDDSPIVLEVPSLAEASRFYDKALQPLGYYRKNGSHAVERKLFMNGTMGRRTSMQQVSLEKQNYRHCSCPLISNAQYPTAAFVNRQHNRIDIILIPTSTTATTKPRQSSMPSLTPAPPSQSSFSSPPLPSSSLQAKHRHKRPHLVFFAPSHQQLLQFWQAALHAGATPLQQPCLQDIEASILSACVKDLWGNKVEVRMTNWTMWDIDLELGLSLRLFEAHLNALWNESLGGRPQSDAHRVEAGIEHRRHDLMSSRKLRVPGWEGIGYEYLGFKQPPPRPSTTMRRNTTDARPDLQSRRGTESDVKLFSGTRGVAQQPRRRTEGDIKPAATSCGIQMKEGRPSCGSRASFMFMT